MLRVTSVCTDQLRFGVLCLLGYVVLSWAVRFDMRLGGQIASLTYPLDTFSMYAGMPGEDRSYLLLRDEDGKVHRVTAFRSFDCEGPLDAKTVPCFDRLGIPYMVEEFLRHIRAHPGSGDEQVDLIARRWQLRAGAAPIQEPDCVVTRCRVSR